MDHIFEILKCQRSQFGACSVCNIKMKDKSSSGHGQIFFPQNILAEIKKNMLELRIGMSFASKDNYVT